MKNPLPCSRLCQSWCILLVWCMYSYCYWILYDWNILKEQYSAWKSDLSWMQILILVSMGLVQITCSRFADTLHVSVLLPACAALGALPFLFFRESYVGLVFIQVVHGCAVALIVPASAKFYASVFNDEHLNLVFCLLYLSTICSKVLVRVANIGGSKQLETIHIIRIFVCVLIAVISLWILKVIKNRESSSEGHVHKFSFQELWATPIVRRLSVSFMLLRFTQVLVTSDFTTKFVIQYSRISVDSVEILVGISGFLGGIILSYVFEKNAVVNFLPEMHIFCYFLIAVCAILAIENTIDYGIILLLFGLYFDTTGIFLSGSVAVRVGEGQQHSGAAVTGIVNGFGNLAHGIALIMDYFLPSSVTIFAIIFSGAMYTFSVYELSKFNVKASLSSKSNTI